MTQKTLESVERIYKGLKLALEFHGEGLYTFSVNGDYKGGKISVQTNFRSIETYGNIMGRIKSELLLKYGVTLEELHIEELPKELGDMLLHI
jgi:hypothetical protein